MKNIELDRRWLSVDDVAVYLGIGRGTVYKWVERYALPAKKVGRLLKFRRAEIDEWMESRTRAKAHDAVPDRFIRRLRDAMPEIKIRFGVRKLGLFGSTARSEAGPASDVDVLVEFEEPTFDRYMDLKFYLEDIFGRPCDLVLADSLKEGVRGSALSEVVYA
ncbi:MAG: helix-turn-helix domain-containing protein [Candidatus Aminicenantales bacterium]